MRYIDNIVDQESLHFLHGVTNSYFQWRLVACSDVVSMGVVFGMDLPLENRLVLVMFMHAVGPEVQSRFRGLVQKYLLVRQTMSQMRWFLQRSLRWLVVHCGRDAWQWTPSSRVGLALHGGMVGVHSWSRLCGDDVVWGLVNDVVDELTRKPMGWKLRVHGMMLRIPGCGQYWGTHLWRVVLSLMGELRVRDWSVLHIMPGTAAGAKMLKVCDWTVARDLLLWLYKSAGRMLDIGDLSLALCSFKRWRQNNPRASRDWDVRYLTPKLLRLNVLFDV